MDTTCFLFRKFFRPKQLKEHCISCVAGCLTKEWHARCRTLSVWKDNWLGVGGVVAYNHALEVVILAQTTVLPMSFRLR